MLYKRVLLFALMLSCSATFAQKRQPNQPTDVEPGIHSSQTGTRAQEETFPPNAGVVPAEQPEQPKTPFDAGMKYRLVGPFRGGRALAVAGVPGEPDTYYFGAASGGVWKTNDGGLSWKPLWDKFPEAAPTIGAIAIAPSDPNVVYVATGEACIRGNIVMGNGVYKSVDAGHTWKYIGLRDTYSIGRMIVHPTNPNIVYVAALGHPFGPNPTRGVFRTTDGGKNWQRVLYVDDKTGAIDIQFDPSNPNILWTGMWQAIRKPWTFESGGPGSGLYRSGDAGDTWKKVSGNGLPEGIWGRIGVAPSANPNRIYALIEAKMGGLYRSDDGGENWQLMNGDNRYKQRAWYYTHVFADPKNPDVVYVLNTASYRSIDGGKTFATLRTPHGDNHGFWIDPTNTKRMMNGNDGGATISTDGGMTWSQEMNQPTAQIYHVSTDTQFPYRILGAQQDNTTIEIASATATGGIGERDFYPVGGGESGYVEADPSNPDVVYAGSYGGDITKYDHKTGQEQAINPWPRNPIGWGMADLKYRFQWTEPIQFSPHDPKVLYYAGNVLFKTTDQGMSWQAISPDLTRNDKSKQAAAGGPLTKDNTGVEVYDTIFSVVESPAQAGLIWAGSDDGLIHITRDGGGHWDNVTPKAMPEWGTVDMIEADPRDAGTAYVAVERHKMDDFTPYAFKTTDFGKTWTAIVNGIPKDDYVHAVRIDPKRKGLLYAATEKGIYMSFDDGANWRPFQLNLPMVPVDDLVYKNNDLVVATHGRAFWVLDDVGPLEQWNDNIKNDNLHLFTPSEANHTTFPGSFFGEGSAGQNPPAGAVIYYYLKTEIKQPKKGAEGGEQAQGESAQANTNAQTASASAPGEAAGAAAHEPGQAPVNQPQATGRTQRGERAATNAQPKAETSAVKLEILDASGKVIRTYPPKEEEAGDSDEGFGRRGREEGLPTKQGINRFVWDMRYESAKSIPNSPLWGGSTRGPEALPGKYTVRLTVNGETQSAPLTIVPDPRLKVTEADLKKQFDLHMQINDKVTQVHTAIQQMRDVRAQINALDKRLKQENNPNAKTIADAGSALDKKMLAIEEELIATKAKSGQDVLNYPIKLNNLLVALGGVVSSADAAPTQQDYDLFKDLSQQADGWLAKWQELQKSDLASLNQAIRQDNIEAIQLLPAGQ